MEEKFRQEVDRFFKGIAPLESGYSDHTFSYVAVRHGTQWLLLQGLLIYNNAPSNIPSTHFKSTNIRAGCYRLTELGIDGRTIVKQLLSGGLETPNERLEFQKSYSYGTAYVDFYPAGLQNQQRSSILTLTGRSLLDHVKQPALDWDLMANSTPYDGLQDIASEYGLNILGHHVATVEVVSTPVAIIDTLASRVNGTNASIQVRAAAGLSVEKIRLGYKVLSQGRWIARSSCCGNTLHWTEVDGIRIGHTEIPVPEAAVLRCIVSYDGIVQHHWGIGDPSRAQNPRRAAYETVDPGLRILRDNLAGKGKIPQDDFEIGVTWLLWMLGFSPAHLGIDKRLHSSDILLVTSGGNLAVVECTTGLLKTHNKMAHLIERTETIKREVQFSGVRILSAMITSKSIRDLKPELPDAQKHGVLVVAQEQLAQLLEVRTLALPNADVIFEEAERAIRIAQERHAAEPELNLVSRNHSELDTGTSGT